MHDIRRIVLLDYNKEQDTLQLRHFVATTPDAEKTDETVMKIVEGKITDFGKYEDISEFFLGYE
jgi:hypothetical protein